MKHRLVTLCSILALGACGDDPSSPNEERPDATLPEREPDAGAPDKEPDAAAPRPFTVTTPTGEVFELSFEDGDTARVTKGPARLRLGQTDFDWSVHMGSLSGDTIGAKCRFLAGLPTRAVDLMAQPSAGVVHFALPWGPRDPKLEDLIRAELVRRGWIAASGDLYIDWDWGAMTPKTTFEAGAMSSRILAGDEPGAPTIAVLSAKIMEDEAFIYVPNGSTAALMRIAFLCDLVLGNAKVEATTETGPTIELVVDPDAAS